MTASWLERTRRRAAQWPSSPWSPRVRLALAPTSVSLTVAAGISTTGATAWQALREMADVQAGQTVLVHAGSGGVGSFAVQLARRAGARVVATASPAGVDTARRLGADEVIDYTTTDVRAAVSNVDVVLDSVGGDVEMLSLDVLKPGGLLLSLPVPPDAERAAARGMRAEFVFHASDAARLAMVVEAVDDGVEVLVDRVVPLSQAAEALRVVAAGHAKGKVVVEPRSA